MSSRWCGAAAAAGWRRAPCGTGHYNRRVKIYTRTGDAGDTGLLDGSRVSKAAPRVEACGDVDELNACLGLVLSTGVDTDLADMLGRIQGQLFSLGATLADPASGARRHPKAAVDIADVGRLERCIDTLETELAPLRKFILPGGHPAAAATHLARAVCRRAERRLAALELDAVGAVPFAYVNRLSDLLFVLARVLNARAAVSEQEW